MTTSTNKQENAQIEKLSTPIAENVAIIGAGPGGLATAIALQKQGFNVQVYEKTQELRPAGIGLGLLPNGLNCLDAIAPGIVESLKHSGCQVSKGILKDITGETIRANPTSRYLEKYGRPLVTVWWWRLQQILATRLPSDMIHLNHHCIGFEQHDRGVELYFVDTPTAKASGILGSQTRR